MLNRKTILKFIPIYLWILPIVGSVSVFVNTDSFRGLDYLLAFITITAIPILIWFWFTYKKENGISSKFWQDKNLYSLVLEKYSRVVILIYFFIVIPATLVLVHFIKHDIAYIYYWLMILLSIITPYFFLLSFFISIYNLLTNIKSREAWKRFGISFLYYLIIFIFVICLIILLNKIYGLYN